MVLDICPKRWTPQCDETDASPPASEGKAVYRLASGVYFDISCEVAKPEILPALE